MAKRSEHPGGGGCVMVRKTTLEQAVSQESQIPKFMVAEKYRRPPTGVRWGKTGEHKCSDYFFVSVHPGAELEGGGRGRDGGQTRRPGREYLCQPSVSGKKKILNSF